jgi:hypothetical protein
MGLEEGRRFTVKMPEGGGKGYVRILREGLAHAAWLSVHGSGEQTGVGGGVCGVHTPEGWGGGRGGLRKSQKIIEEGKARGSLKLEGFEKEVEVDGKRHMVKVIGGGAEIEESRRGKKLLRIKITAEVDGVRREYEITYGRYGTDNVARGIAHASVNVPGGRRQTPRGTRR